MITAMTVHIWFDISFWSVSLDVSARMKKYQPTFRDYFELLKPKWLQTVTEWKANLCCRLCCCWALLALWNTSHSDSFSLQSLAVGWESVESFGRGAHLVWWRQKPSARIKADISLWERESGPRERTTVQTNNGSCSFFFLFFFIYSAQQVSATAASLPSLTPHGCSAPPYERKTEGRGGELPPGIRYLNPILRSSELQWS